MLKKGTKLIPRLKLNYKLIITATMTIIRNKNNRSDLILPLFFSLTACLRLISFKVKLTEAIMIKKIL